MGSFPSKTKQTLPDKAFRWVKKPDKGSERSAGTRQLLSGTFTKRRRANLEPPELNQQAFISFQANQANINTGGGDVGCHNKYTVNNYDAGPFNEEKELRDGIGRILQPRLALEDLYDAAGKDLCYKDTRVDIINKILSWARTPLDASDEAKSEVHHQCLCITGAPGIGKSTLSATLASCLKDEGILHAHYVVSRSAKKSADCHNVFPTIAYQLAERSTVAARSIDKTLQERPSLVDRLTSEQAKLLFLDPINAIAQSTHPKSIVIVIDALDELAGAGCASFVSSLASVVGDLPPSAKVILTSRPENSVVEALRCKVEDLDLKTEESIEDVEVYIRGKLGEIVPKGEQGKIWPREEDVAVLSSQASGLFAWAATALKFVESQIRLKGRAYRHNVVMDQLNRVGMTGLDQLYSFILNTVVLDVCVESGDDEEITRFTQVVGCLLVLAEPLPITGIGDLLHISLDDYDLLNFFERLRSVLISGTGMIEETTIPQMHKSFVDYLTSRANPQLRIDEHSHHSKILTLAFQTMRSLHFNMFSLESSYVRNADTSDLGERLSKIPRSLLYSCDNWPYHMENGHRLDDIVLQEVKEFLENRLLAWLEILAMREKLDVLGSTMVKLRQCIKGQNEGLDAFARDASRFIAVYLPMMRESIAHIYLSALPLSPSSSVVANTYRHRYPNTVSAANKSADWDPEVLAVRSPEPIYSIALSPDDRYLASSCGATIRIWSTDTGMEVRTLRVSESSGRMTSVIFSPDGRRVISCSFENGSIAVWDALSGEVIATTDDAHSDGSRSRCISCSPDGKRLISGSNEIRIWNLETYEMVYNPLKGSWLKEDTHAASVAFSQDNPVRFATGASDGTVEIWDINTQEVVIGPLRPSRRKEAQSQAINSVAFSSDGKQLASGSADCLITVYDAETGEIIAGPFRAHASPISCVAFSPDGTQLLSCSDHIIVWDTEMWTVSAGPFHGDGKDILSASFSHNGRYIISASHGSIRVWDAEGNSTPLREPEVPLAREIGFSAEGKEVLLCSHSDSRSSGYSGSGSLLTYLDLVSGKATRRRKIEDGRQLSGRSVKFSSDGQYIAGALEQRIYLLHTGTGSQTNPELPPSLKRYMVESVLFSPDGLLLACICYENYDGYRHLFLWNPRTGEASGHCALQNWCGMGLAQTFGALSLDGDRFLASSSSDEVVRLWDVNKGSEITMANPIKISACILLCSPVENSQFVTALASELHGAKLQRGKPQGGEPVCLWDMTGNRLVRFNDGSRKVKSIAYSPNGRYILSGHPDESVRIWDVATGQLVTTLLHGHDSLPTFAFSPNGRHIATFVPSAAFPFTKSETKDRTVKIWDIESVITNALKQQDDDALQFRDDSKLENGWIVGRNSELLLWIPPAYRKHLWRPSNTCVIAQNNLRLGWTNAVQGEEWLRCCT